MVHHGVCFGWLQRYPLRILQKTDMSNHLRNAHKKRGSLGIFIHPCHVHPFSMRIQIIKPALVTPVFVSTCPLDRKRTSLSGESAPVQHPAQPVGAANPSVAIPATPATPATPALTSPSRSPQCCASRLVPAPGEAGHPEVPRCGHFRRWVLRHRTSPSPGELHGRAYGSTRAQT